MTITQQYQTLKENVSALLKEQLPPIYQYHSIEHTMNMLSLVDTYCEPYSLDPHQTSLLKIAILFHDIAFIEDWHDHEKRGAEIAEEELKKMGFESEDIQIVKDLIIATRLPQEPNSTLEKIICDIDLDYLGREDYFERSELLFNEWTSLGLIKDREEWKSKEIEFLENHQFHSTYAIANRQPILSQNLQKARVR